MYCLDDKLDVVRLSFLKRILPSHPSSLLFHSHCLADSSLLYCCSYFLLDKVAIFFLLMAFFQGAGNDPCPARSGLTCPPPSARNPTLQVDRMEEVSLRQLSRTVPKILTGFPVNLNFTSTLPSAPCTETLLEFTAFFFLAIYRNKIIVNMYMHSLTQHTHMSLSM